MKEASEQFTRETGVKFGAIEITSSGKGIEAVIQGKAKLAGASRPLSDAEMGQNVYYQIFAYDAIAVFVNQKNPVNNLSQKQIQDIFTGKIRNWKEVGGQDAAINCYTGMMALKKGTVLEFQQMALDGKDYLVEKKEMENTHDQAAAIASDVNGITAVSLSFSLPGIKAVSVNQVFPISEHVRSGAYLFSRPLLLVALGPPEGDVKMFFNFILSSNGQKIVGKKFVPLNE